MTAPLQCALPFVTCEVNSRAAPPDIRQQTDGTARHGMLVIMYVDIYVHTFKGGRDPVRAKPLPTSTSHYSNNMVCGRPIFI